MTTPATKALPAVRRPLNEGHRQRMADVRVGMVFGMSLDTATEVALLTTTTLRASEHIAWQAVLAPPLLFTAGMSPMDTFTGPLEGA
jgi:high-affinity nickel permease